jgi:predicted DNA-binding protein YlxM (UPF0122 family)
MATIGEWEKHTRGIGSKLLQKYGYKKVTHHLVTTNSQGMGLGKESQGIPSPVGITRNVMQKPVGLGHHERYTHIHASCVTIKRTQEKNEKPPKEVKKVDTVFDFMNSALSYKETQVNRVFFFNNIKKKPTKNINNMSDKNMYNMINKTQNGAQKLKQKIRKYEEELKRNTVYWHIRRCTYFKAMKEQITKKINIAKTQLESLETSEKQIETRL